MKFIKLLGFSSLFLLMLLPTITFGAGEDTFSSTSEMAALADKEARMVMSLRKYKDSLEERLKLAKMDLAEIRRKLNEKTRHVVVKSELADENLRKSRTLLATEMEGLPSQKQMEGAAQGIFLLQVNTVLYKSTHD